MNDKPNMYAVLPANVRYHEGLSNFAKIIFSEITALSNKNGYCHASNGYFAKVFNVDVKTISRAIKELSEVNAIKIKDGAGGESIRKVTPCSPSQKLLAAPGTNSLTPPDKNVPQNTTSIILQDTISKDIVELPKLTLPLDSKSPLNRVLAMYSLLWSARYGTRPTINYPRAGKSLKPLVDSLGEYKTALVMIQYFSWRGATGDDEFLNKRLASNTFPVYWIPDHADSILAYLRNVIKVDVDSESQVKQIVDRKLKELGA
jgi:hypothetical protein